MSELRAYQKKVGSVKVTEGRFYVVDYKTGDILECDPKHPEYIKYKKERLEKKKVKAQERAKKVEARIAKAKVSAQKKSLVLLRKQQRLTEKQNKLNSMLAETQKAMSKIKA